MLLSKKGKQRYFFRKHSRHLYVLDISRMSAMSSTAFTGSIGGSVSGHSLQQACRQVAGIL